MGGREGEREGRREGGKEGGRERETKLMTCCYDTAASKY